MTKYLSIQEAAHNGENAVYAVDTATESLVQAQFLHICSDGEVNTNDGYLEEYRRKDGQWWYTHCGFGAGCFWTEPEQVSGHPFAGCKAGDICSASLWD